MESFLTILQRSHGSHSLSISQSPNFPKCFYSQLDYKDYELEIFTSKTSVNEVEGRINYHFTEISSSLNH